MMLTVDLVGEEETTHWLVTDRFAFENVGVTKPVSLGGDNGGGYRLLVCADCDRGPLGIVFDSEPSVYYVTDSRVKYLS